MTGINSQNNVGFSGRFFVNTGNPEGLIRKVRTCFRENAPELADEFVRIEESDPTSIVVSADDKHDPVLKTIIDILSDSTDEVDGRVLHEASIGANADAFEKNNFNHTFQPFETPLQELQILKPRLRQLRVDPKR